MTGRDWRIKDLEVFTSLLGKEDDLETLPFRSEVVGYGRQPRENLKLSRDPTEGQIS